MPPMCARPDSVHAGLAMNIIGLIASESPERAHLAARLNDGVRQVIVFPADASMAALLSRGVDALVVDLSAPGALRFLRRNAAQHRRLPVICLANGGRPNSSAAALRLGAADVIPSPVRADELRASLLNVASLVTRVRDEETEMPEFDAGDHGVVSMSLAMQRTLELVHRVAASRSSVMMVGERGSGRERLARVIHAGGAHPGRFLKLACGVAEIADVAATLSEAGSNETTLYLEEVAD